MTPPSQWAVKNYSSEVRNVGLTFSQPKMMTAGLRT